MLSLISSARDPTRPKSALTRSASTSARTALRPTPSRSGPTRSVRALARVVLGSTWTKLGSISSALSSISSALSSISFVSGSTWTVSHPGGSILWVLLLESPSSPGGQREGRRLAPNKLVSNGVFKSVGPRSPGRESIGSAAPATPSGSRSARSIRAPRAISTGGFPCPRRPSCGRAGRITC
jgi:hypothetical protein